MRAADPDRHVDQEDPAPTRRDQQAADDWAHGGGHATDRRPGAHGTLPALGRVGGEDQPEGGRGQQGRPGRLTRRKPISMPTLVEAAQAADAAVKMATPRRKARSRR